MTYTEKELDQFLHGISLSLLSKKSAQHWRYDEETAKEIEWLEALERKVRADKADRKTEPRGDDIIVRSNLEQFRVGLEYHTDTTHFGKAKGESITTNKIEDEPQRGCDADCNEDCTECAKDLQDWKDRMWAEAIVTEPTISKMEQVDEPQTERSE